MKGEAIMIAANYLIKEIVCLGAVEGGTVI